MTRSPWLLRALFPGLLWHGDRKLKQVFLTFDDGPHPDVTPRVLDLLEQYHAKATFFCVGANVEAYPQIFHRLRESGHTVGNHTWSHCSGWGMSRKAYVDEVQKTAILVPGRLFRPPYGRIGPAQYFAVRKTHHVVMWDVLSYDWKSDRSSERIAADVLKAIRPGSVVVFHDSAKAAPRMLSALEIVLQGLNTQGLECVALDAF
ncbi:MAG: polysaccharide deacetylase family protein [Bacteroidota bacterium]